MMDHPTSEKFYCRLAHSYLSLSKTIRVCIAVFIHTILWPSSNCICF